MSADFSVAVLLRTGILATPSHPSVILKVYSQSRIETLVPGNDIDLEARVLNVVTKGDKIFRGGLNGASKNPIKAMMARRKLTKIVEFTRRK